MNPRLAAVLALASLLVEPSHASFHLMQIEQVIGGVEGDTGAQAIQLRMRSSGQNLVSSASVWAADANGSNRVLLLNIASNVSAFASGSRILLATPGFTSAMNSGGGSFAPDFTLAAAIPPSYLNAGKITFEADGGTVSTPGTIYWSFAWGGASYTGTDTGLPSASGGNDADGNYGPAFGSALPITSRQGVIFTGATTALSTTNAADYAFTANPATVFKNNGTSFVVVPEPGIGGLLLLGGLAFTRRHRW